MLMVKIKSIYYWLVGHKSRVNYWSCSKFADWLRSNTGVTKKLTAGTSQEWAQWKSDNAGKVGYWIAEELLDYIQDVFLFIPDVYHNAKVYVYNRWIDKTHYINTKLDKGKYYGFDTTLLHGIFEMLVDFVEVEKAQRQFSSRYFEGDKTKYKTPSREAGIEYLDWEIGLGDDSPLQAEVAVEIKELYLWWKDVRPNRIDPMDESGWSAYCEKESIAGRGLFGCNTEEETEERRLQVRALLKELQRLEDKQDQEDTDMLIRIIKIRQHCWT